MRAMKKPFLILSLLGVALALGACTTTRPGLAGLTVELAKIEIEGATARATVRYTNPNLMAYNLAQTRHKIQIGAWSGVAESREAFGVPPRNTVEQTVALKPERIDQLTPGAAEYRMESDFSLRLYGESRESLELSARGRTVVVRK
jgi:hypothetical protein